jgi:hypothetical protein
LPTAAAAQDWRWPIRGATGPCSGPRPRSCPSRFGCRPRSWCFGQGRPKEGRRHEAGGAAGGHSEKRIRDAGGPREEDDRDHKAHWGLVGLAPPLPQQPPPTAAEAATTTATEASPRHERRSLSRRCGLQPSRRRPRRRIRRRGRCPGHLETRCYKGGSAQSGRPPVTVRARGTQKRTEAARAVPAVVRPATTRGDLTAAGA